MDDIWRFWSWPIAATRAWLELWFGAPVAPAAHPAPAADDEPPCTDHDLFA